MVPRRGWPCRTWEREGGARDFCDLEYGGEPHLSPRQAPAMGGPRLGGLLDNDASMEEINYERGPWLIDHIGLVIS
jgi:hypothetical protein